MTTTWMPPDPRTFRDTLGRFASGVVVVGGVDRDAGANDGRPVGLTCQSFFSVSLHPPLVAVAPSSNSSSWRAIERSGAFAVSVLAEGSTDACLTFGRSGPLDKFATVGWHRAPSGSPVLRGALAWLDCRIHAIHPAGDHYLVVGEVDYLGAGDGAPLLFYRGGFGSFATHETSPQLAGRPDWTAEDVWGTGLWLEGVDW